MIERLTALQKRVAALALTVALAGLGYAALVRPVLQGHRHYDERIAELSHRLERYQRVAKDREATQKLLDQRKRADLAKRYYLAERNPALASAELQGLVKRAVEQGKGELISTQVVSGQRADRPTDVTVKVTVRGDIRALQKALYALESGRPILFVNNLTIASGAPTRAARLMGQAGARLMGQAGGKDFVINMDVSGYMRERQG